MVTIRIPEEKITEQVIIRCPECAVKGNFNLTSEQICELFDGDAVKLFCSECSEGFNLEIEY